MRALKGVYGKVVSMDTVRSRSAVGRSGAIDRFDLRLPRDNWRLIRVEPLDGFLIPLGSVAPGRLG